MKVKILVSGRHCHLTKEDFEILFGTGAKLTIRNELTQPGQFASNEKINVKYGERIIEGVRILGPFRDYTQVELSRTDYYALKTDAPVRRSGDLVGSRELTLIGPNGSVTKECGIIADRHIHVSRKDYDEKFRGIEKVKVRVDGEKALVYENVHFKPSDKATYEMHIDTDDANAALIYRETEGKIIFL